MEYIIGVLLLIVGFLYNRNQKDKVASKLAETRARDRVLKEQQAEARAQIQTLDAGIQKMKQEREIEAKKRAEDKLTLKERADRIKKGLK